MSDLVEIESRIAEQLSPAERAWIVPLLGTLESLGGEGKPKDVEQAVKNAYQTALTDEEWAAVMKGNRIRWVRSGLCKSGLMDGEYGVWRITDDGRAYLEAHCGDNIALTAPKERQVDPTLNLEFVKVTDFAAFHRPVLAAIADGISERKLVMEHLRAQLRPMLLEGDFRKMPQGEIVWEFRAHWAFSALLSEGLVINPSRGKWIVTDAGRKRLQEEDSSIKVFQTDSEAKVIADGTPSAAQPDVLSEDQMKSVYDWRPSWEALPESITQKVWSDINDSLRPDLGTIPDEPFGRNVILYGPPGTGKTWVADRVAAAFGGDDEHNRMLVQFHPSYCYEDFVQGLKPSLTDTQLRFSLVPGPFLNACGYASDHQDQFVVLVIDEINRGDPARIFGELLYALEYRDKAISLPSGTPFMVPSNLIVIGTMNSVDRSVALVDYALRRRFNFVRMDPQPDVIDTVRHDEPMSSAAVRVLREFNKWLETRLDVEHTIGHSFFLSPAIKLKDRTVFEKIWKLNVKPLMEEYFFSNRQGVAEAEIEWKRLVEEAVNAVAAGED